jgi:hypothetical protein
MKVTFAGNPGAIFPQPSCRTVDCERSGSDGWQLKCYCRSVVAGESYRCRGEKPRSRLQSSVMLKRVAHVRVVCFCLLTTCGAVCQSGHTSWNSLPDAPSARVARVAQNVPQAPSFQRVSDEARLPLVGGVRARTAFVYESFPDQDQPESGVAFFKRLYPSLLNPNSRYRASANDSLMGRATDAASRIFVSRDADGRRRFNTSYLLRVATSVAADSASRTYRARSGTAPLGDFGSTVGNDAGMNLMHEFGPAMRHMVTGHLPEFVSRIGARILR